MTTSPDETTVKAAFYLEHRDAIEEWAALREEGKAVIEAALMTTVERLQELSVDAGAEAWVEADRTFPLLLARRPQWKRGAVEVSVGISWDRNKLLRPGLGEWPWAGVYVDGYDSPAGRRVTERLRALPVAKGQSKNLPWALWRYVPAEASRPVDPDVLARSTLSVAEQLFVRLSKHLGENPFESS